MNEATQVHSLGDAQIGPRKGYTRLSPIYLLVAPAVLLLLTFLLVPTAAVLVLSVSDYRLGIDDWSFVGFENYVAMARDPLFWTSLRNTWTYVIVVVPLSVGLGLGVALLIESRTYLKRFYRVAYFLPVTATLVAMATVWEFIFHPNIGLANAVLGSFGVAPIRFLGSPDNALFSLCAIGVWELVGFNMVLFLAGLSGIPRELNEAASIDGADGSIDRFLTVTWPMLGPTTLFVVIITAVRAFRVFETVAVLTQGGPDKATEVLLYTMYLEGFQYFRIGYASALTVVFLSFTVILILAQVRVAERRIHY